MMKSFLDLFYGESSEAHVNKASLGIEIADSSGGVSTHPFHVVVSTR
jgi:hypothetical protein